MNIIRSGSSTLYTIHSSLLEEYSSTGELLYLIVRAPTCTGKRQYSTHPLMHCIQCIPPPLKEIKNRQFVAGQRSLSGYGTPIQPNDQDSVIAPKNEQDTEMSSFIYVPPP
jgi:hypothetical protein